MRFFSFPKPFLCGRIRGGNPVGLLYNGIEEENL